MADLGRWGVLVVGMSMASCDGSGRVEGAQRAQVRDSAGVTIVENGGAAPAAWRLSLEPLLRIGAGLAVDQTPLDPTAVFAGPRGTIAVADGNQVGWDAILLYDPDGRFVRKLGGSGRGPGEFGGQLWWAGPYRGDSLVAWDRRGPTGPSVKVFGPDGGYARDVEIPRLQRRPPDGTMSFSVGFHGAFTDGSLLTSSEGVIEPPGRPGPVEYRHVILSVGPTGAPRDTIAELGMGRSYWDGRRQVMHMYAGFGSVAVIGDDVLRGTAPEYEYRVLDRSGVPKLIVRKEHDPEPVTAADVQAVVAAFLEGASRAPDATEERLADLRRTVEAFPRADFKPAYSRLLADDHGRVWVERFRWLDPWTVPPGSGPTTWDVFSSEGTWIAELVVPPSVLVMSVSGDRVFTVRVDVLDERTVEVFELLTS